MQCPACSTENPAGATFCQHCGASLSAAPPPPPSGGFTQVPQPAAAPVGAGYVPAQSGLSDNAAAAIAYVTIIPAIIFLVLEPYNRKPFVRYHAMQCIGLHVLWFAVWIAIMILTVALSMIHMGWLISLLGLLCWLGLVILWVICIVSAAQGKWFKIPVIGDFVRKQAGA
ncbi:MAG TPA: DUF4870 domain-containing protein [Acidobacteriaceae bacterium]|nr:DUF4870 domain-containing protein [Acidobacteriaceae bacterium]